MKIEEDKKFDRGDVGATPVLRHTVASACYFTSSSENLHYEEDFEKLVGKIADIKIGLKHLTSLGCKIQVTSYIEDFDEKGMPAVHFAAKHIQVLGEIPCSIDIDLY